MNMEDEEEYVDFYDFSKTYENHPLLIKPLNPAIKEEAKEDEEGDTEKRKPEDEEWEDCDFEDLKSDDEDQKTEEEFVVVEDSKSQSF